MWRIRQRRQAAAPAVVIIVVTIIIVVVVVAADADAKFIRVMIVQSLHPHHLSCSQVG